MASFAATRPVNPPGVELVLTEEQVWKALEYKARNPALFVKAITSAEVVKDGGNKVTRLVSIMNGPKVQEDIESHANAVIYFDFTERPNRVLNVLSYGPEGEMLLTYCFAGGIPGVDPKDDKTVEELNKMVGGVIDHGIGVIRDLVREGKL
ncbi:hypothetical protein JCM3766R1_000970 [Sporobolomyces carnicolor]